MGEDTQSDGPGVVFSTSPLLPLSNVWLKEMTEHLRGKQTAWEGYQRAQLISADQVPLLRDAEQAGKKGEMAPIKEKGSTYAGLYMQLLDKLNRTDTIQAVLLLTDDLVQAAPEHLAWFVQAEPYAALTKLMKMDDAFVSIKAAQFLTLCLCAHAESSDSTPPHAALESLLAYIHRALSSLNSTEAPSDGAKGNVAPIALCLAGELLRTPRFRSAIWAKDVEEKQANDDTTLVGQLVAVLGLSFKGSGASGTNSSGRASGNTGVPQLHYLALFGLWVLTFDEAAAKDIDTYFGVATVLVHVAQLALKHKIVRLIVSIWRNMLSASKEANATRLLGAKVLPLCDTLQERRYPDTELQDDLEYVKSVLSHRMEQMSSYDQYVSELYSGHLSFDNPAHQLEEFWKENAEKMTENDNKDLKQLISLLSSKSSTPDTLAAACSDLDKFVQHTEGGRRRVTSLGAKTAIMELIEHPDPNVKHQALQTLAKLVSASWR
ncbi:H(+)-transporting V1 sector ATPase subunit H [Malassezia pachydermatis]|uniref:V-type proton ATPase subunit H n=1 Tax=Malassezia pachydermatis TaxID=77020 RepID=A0A0N0RSQ8_9BASI|nr:vacuolar atp synthase subunit h [Malassezia pachydermatis]KOS16353.1 vacuolar atp synthase subunit h [Malassezia pachydermatis]